MSVLNERSQGPASFSLSEEGRALIQKEMRRYETKLSCLIPSLFQIQKEKGWISKEAVVWLSKETGIHESKIHEVLMFYTLLNKKPVGRFHIQVCRNVSCYLKGSHKLLEDLRSELQVKEGEMRSDGKVTLSPVECLGACDQAPVVQVNQDRLDQMTVQKILAVMDEK